uniref:Soluble Rieske-type ferredoxin domain-containing protein n=1 Tax=Sinocyclocheilus anshuiensis TaxID=1608454 RepID=A0A671MJM7_9TELE
MDKNKPSRITFYAMDLQCTLDTHCYLSCEGLYKATNPTEKVPIPQWYSKGMKQRVHKVTEVDEDIFVTLSNCPGWVESDYYQTEKGRAELRKAQESEVGEEDVNADEDV